MSGVRATATTDRGRWPIVGATAFAVALLLGACGGAGTATESADGAAQDPSGGGTQVGIIDNAFEPNELEATAGTAVEWKNNGTAAHTVTFEGGEDSGNVASGGTYRRTFDAAGEFPYSCSIHPEMTGTVTVAG